MNEQKIKAMILGQRLINDTFKKVEAENGINIKAFGFNNDSPVKHILIRDYMWRIIVEAKEAQEVINHETDLAEELVDVMSFTLNLCDLVNVVPKYLGRVMFKDSYPNMVLEICYKLERSLGTKPWRKKHKKTYQEDLECHLSELFTLTVSFLQDYMGKDAHDEYWKKNKKNMERINGGY